MNRREVLKGSGALAAAAATGIPSATAQAPIVIKFSHVVATDAPKGKASEKFKELAEKYTGGKVKVEVYANSSLYKDKEELEALQLGAVQLLAPSTSKFGPLGFNEFEALDLPFIFHDEASVQGVRQQRSRQADVRQARDQGREGPRLLGQRLPRHGRQPPDPRRQGLPGPQAAHPGLQGARRHHQGVGRDPAGDGLLRGLPCAADRRGRRPGERALEFLDAEVLRGGEVHRRLPPRPPFLRGGGQQASSGTACPPTCEPAWKRPWRRRRAYFDSIAKKENDDALEDIRKTGKVQVYPLTPDGAQILGAGGAAGAQGDGEAHRQGDHRRALQGGRFQAGCVTK